MTVLPSSRIQRAWWWICAGCLALFVCPSVAAQLKSNEAKKLITRMAGFELTGGSVRVKNVAASSATTADVTADIRVVFRFEKNPDGGWRIAEVRTGPNTWENVELIRAALSTENAMNDCQVADPPFKGADAVDPSAKRARCLLGSLLGIDVPSDAIRIQEISPMVIPLASQPSSVVVAWVRVEARTIREPKSGWQVTELRTGKGDWVKLHPLLAALNQEKHKRARIELESIAQALERFRAQRGSYVISDDQVVAINHLNPRYLSRVIRVDPWHREYKYQGERDRFILRSSGPDGKEGTADDIELRRPTR